MAYLPKLKPAIGNQLGGMPERRQFAADIIQSYLNPAISGEIGATENLSTSGSSFSTVVDIYISKDGANLFIAANANDFVKQFSLSIPWDITSYSYIREALPSGYSPSSSNGICAFSEDGKNMYALASTTDVITHSTLSTAWDISTLTGGNSHDFSTQSTSISSLLIKPDGSKCIINGTSGGDVVGFDMSTPFDIGSASSFVTYLGLGFNSGPLWVSPDGQFIVMLDPSNNRLTYGIMSIPWDVSTIVKYPYILIEGAINNGLVLQPTIPAGRMFGGSAITSIHQSPSLFEEQL